MEIMKAGLAGGLGALFIAFLISSVTTPESGSGMFLSQFSPAQTAAAPEVAALRLDFGRELVPSRCGGVGSPVVAVTQKIEDTIDSGEGGNYWAHDDFSRKIQVWRVKGEQDTYCAVVEYQGSFDAFEGVLSPGATGVLTGDESGPIQGGYVATITGSLLDTTEWPKRGSVGTTDYQCAEDPNTADCPGAVNWVEQYFGVGYTFNYEWWGWLYRAPQNKVWVNSSDGNHGDII